MSKFFDVKFAKQTTANARGVVTATQYSGVFECAPCADIKFEHESACFYPTKEMAEKKLAQELWFKLQPKSVSMRFVGVAGVGTFIVSVEFVRNCYNDVEQTEQFYRVLCVRSGVPEFVYATNMLGEGVQQSHDILAIVKHFLANRPGLAFNVGEVPNV